MQNRTLIIIGVIGLVLAGIGAADIFTTDAATYAGGENETVNYYLLTGVGLLILSIVGLVRGRK